MDEKHPEIQPPPLPVPAPPPEDGAPLPEPRHEAICDSSGDANITRDTAGVATQTSEVGAAKLPTVPGYELLAELGRGGMGVVYKARHLKLNRIVALKMILSGAHAGREERERFQREAEAVARLQHPGIVQIHEVGEYADIPFLSLEFLAGGSLGSQLRGNPRSARRSAEVVAFLARAMQHAHDHGVIHRDLKPANVLLASDGTPRITDFGLAKRLDAVIGATQTGAVVGTPAYMSPEQAQGRTKDLGPPTDIYALGAVLYELLTGRPPFKGANVMETLAQVVGDDPVPPSRLQPKIPRDLEAICLKSLEKEPGRRYESAAALARDIERYLADEPVKACPPAVGYRLRKFARRHKAGVAITAAASLLLVLGLGGGGWWLQHRQWKVDTAVSGVTADARQLFEEAKRKPSAGGGEYDEALSEARKAHQLALSSGASAEKQTEAAALLAEVEREAKAADEELLGQLSENAKQLFEQAKRDASFGGGKYGEALSQSRKAQQFALTSGASAEKQTEAAALVAEVEHEAKAADEQQKTRDAELAAKLAAERALVEKLNEKPDAEHLPTTQEEMQQAVEERVSLLQQNLEVFLESRKSKFIFVPPWSKGTRSIGTALWGYATVRFGYSNGGGGREVAAEFKLQGGKWQLTDTGTSRPTGPADVVKDDDLMKVLKADKGMSYWLKEGKAQAAAGKWDDAIANLTKAIAEEPSYALPWNERAIA